MSPGNSPDCFLPWHLPDVEGWAGEVAPRGREEGAVSGGKLPRRLPILLVSLWLFKNWSEGQRQLLPWEQPCPRVPVTITASLSHLREPTRVITYSSILNVTASF